MVKVSSISLHLRGKSALTLLDDVKMTAVTHSMPIIIYQSSHQNTESNFEMKINVVGFLFLTNIKDLWLRKLIGFDRIYPPEE